MDTIAQLPTILWNGITSVLGDNPSWDVLLYIVVIGFAVIAGVWGRAKLIGVLLASYIAVALLSLTGISDWFHNSMGVPATVWGYVGVLIGVVAVFFAIVTYGLGDILDDETGSLTTSVVLALSVIGLLTAFLFTQLDIETVNGFSSFTQAVFATGAGRAVWIIIPIIIVGATRD